MGGTSDEEINFGLANLVSLCVSCHRHVHAHPTASYASGFLVHSWDDPELIKIVSVFGVLELCSDGSSVQTGVCDF
jgi:hypothetical protein